MGRLIYNEEDLLISFKEILNYELDINKLRIKGNYGVVYVKRKPYRIHRILGEYYYGNLNGFHIHHKNGNSFDNTKGNLLKVTPSEHTRLYHNDIYRNRSYESTMISQRNMVEKIKRKDITSNTILKLRSKGLTYKEISKELNCGYNTVWRRIKFKNIDWSENE